ncbi:43998_t:CDS:2, partial [Gigaspora margarita]
SEVQKNIKEYLKKHLKNIETKKKAQRCVILGDFNVNLNQIINLDLKEQVGKEGKKQIAQLLRRKRFVDIFYEPNSPGQPIWKCKEAHSRIDTIWVDCHWKQSIIFCKTKDMDLRTVRRKRLEIDIKNVNEKDWEEYRAFLSKELKKKLSKDIGKENAHTDILRLLAIGKQNLRRAMGYYRERLRKNKEKGISYKEVEELEHFIEPLKNRWSLEVLEVAKQDYLTV